MIDPDSEWRLWNGSTLIGTITVDEAGMPWQHGRFLPEPAFSQFRPWFDKANAIVEAEEFERFDNAYDRIESALTVVSRGPLPSSSFTSTRTARGSAGTWNRQQVKTQAYVQQSGRLPSSEGM
ncbi:hypothetical protein [Streptomyces sp. NBC_01483]|uniref:hypothetical protein n=1 Tax=Streptomyces sp. NBC_01483 TaxID=2903883 RepID=UPI002E347D46|nr:hypothetical protein [Streptomyces sp. NBC_01483]